MTCQIDADPLISCGNCGTLIRRIDAFATYDDDRPPWLCVSCKRVWCGEYVCSTCLREYGDHGPFLGCPDCGQ